MGLMTTYNTKVIIDINSIPDIYNCNMKGSVVLQIIDYVWKDDKFQFDESKK
jgi:hypothetical protein